MRTTKTYRLLDAILGAPYLLWILIAFGLSYLLFFITPTFLSSPSMQFFRHVDALPSVGADLFQAVGASRMWLLEGRAPFVAHNIFTPFTYLVFAVFVGTDPALAYRIVTFVNLTCLLLLTLLLPLLVHKQWRVSPLHMLIFATALVSHGLQFEIERGQFNVLAVCFCLFAVWIYHEHKRLRLVAYLLFIVAVQLKLYPMIFVLMFVDDWEDWKANLKRFGMLGLANAAPFLLMGPAAFGLWAHRVRVESSAPGWIYPANFSVHSFVKWELRNAAQDGWQWVKPETSGLLQLALLAAIGACLLLVVLRAFRQRRRGVDPYLLFACVIAAMVVPPISNEYKLSSLAGPAAILFLGLGPRQEDGGVGVAILRVFIVFVLSLAYSTTLYSYTNKPPVLWSNFPVLMVMLICVTLLAWLSKIPPAEGLPEPV